MKPILIALLLTLSLSVNADDWVKLTDTPATTTYVKKGSLITDGSTHALLIRMVNKDSEQTTNFSYAVIENSVCTTGQGELAFTDLKLNPDTAAKDSVVIGGHTVSAVIAQLICEVAK